MIEDLIAIPVLTFIILFGIYCIKTTKSDFKKLIPLIYFLLCFYGIALFVGIVDLIYLLFIK